jgi:hypothetical protein
MEEIEPAAFSGRVQIREVGTRSENWFCAPALDGIAGAGCEPDDGCAAQQLILPPQWQQARTVCLAHAGVGAADNGAHTSRKLNKMADNRFTVLFWCDWALFCLEFRLQAVRAKHRDWPPEGGTPNGQTSFVKNSFNLHPLYFSSAMPAAKSLLGGVSIADFLQVFGRVLVEILLAT